MSHALRSRPKVDPARPASNGRARASARPSLEVVTERSMLRRITPSAVVALTVVTGFAFAALATHISLIDEQRHLDKVRASIVTEQTRQEELRRSASRLQSPDEVIRIATSQLSMVASAKAEIVSPKRALVGVPTSVPTTVLASSVSPAPATPAPTVPGTPAH